MLALSNVPLGNGAPETGNGRGGRAATFSHSFEPGCITVVLGRNRSGKSRLCRVAAGLERPGRGGKVLLGQRDVTGEPPGRRSVALVYQAFVNYPNLSVFDNIASPLRARRLPAAQVRDRALAIADKLELGALLERLPSALSGGQQQRLAIGRALAKSASVLVLDEPLVNLDYKLREALELELRTMLRDEGVTVIYTSSDPRDAFNLGDEVVLLRNGRKLQSGTPLGVYEQPASLAAAELMSDPGVNRFTERGTTWAVRPEHLSLTPPRGPVWEFTLPVQSVETNGSETYLHGTVDGHHWVARLRGLHRVAAGREVRLHAPRDALLRFDGGDPDLHDRPAGTVPPVG